jgi:hypothetical protein
MALEASLPIVQVAEIAEEDPSASWLVRDIWGQQSVGIIGGAPKVWKSWLGLDLAVSVASGTACLGRFEVEQPGRALIYLAEDALTGVRARIASICAHRGLSLRGLDLHVVTAPSLRLDLERDQQRLDASLKRLAPRLLLLDPLVRLHRLDENSAADISGLLGYLRELNRRHAVAIAIVHHMSKKSHRNLGQGLRGSGDINAWTDCAAYLVRKGKDRVQLTLEHRAAAAPEPLLLRLTDARGSLHLEVAGTDAAARPLGDAIREALRRAGGSRTRGALRRELRVNNQRLGDALLVLEEHGLIARNASGWILTATARPDAH